MRQPIFRTSFLLSTVLVVAGCGGGVPGFLGREPTGGGVYDVQGKPDRGYSVPMAVRDLAVEPALHGTIIRVRTVAPTQGYYSAELLPQGHGRPDANGTMIYALAAMRPEEAQSVGPERTRTLTAAIFVPDRVRRQVKSVRIVDTGGARTLQLPPVTP